MSRENRDSSGLRKVKLIANYLENPPGSVLISYGNTKVICTAMIENSVPPWIENDQDNQQGWLTANYGMLPGSGDTRIFRERRGAGGRTKEIERMIGRSLRASLDLGKLGERTIWIDCDVIQADGGTRTASVTGAWVALKLALNKLEDSGELENNPMEKKVAAVSVGLKDGVVLTDLCFKEDSTADVDMNVVMDDQGNFIEVQATGEGGVFSREELGSMLDAAGRAIGDLFKYQEKAVSGE